MKKYGLYTLGTRPCLLFFFLSLLIHHSLLEASVEVVEGDKAILQCKSQRSELDIFWRFEEATQNKVVIDIIGNKEDYHDQNSLFKGRVKGFPSEFANGNYSIQLSNVTISDSGLYTCIILSSNTNRNIKLTVKAKEEETRKEHAEPKGGTEKTECIWSLLLGCVLLCTLKF